MDTERWKQVDNLQAVLDRPVARHNRVRRHVVRPQCVRSDGDEDHLLAGFGQFSQRLRPVAKTNSTFIVIVGAVKKSIHTV